MNKILKVGARDSKLSVLQVEEVEKEIKAIYPHLSFYPTWIKTKGDLDQKTSLKEMEKTDFFTFELDQMLLEKKIDAAIHSAKDLPEKTAKGLTVAAITQGLTSKDSLVMREKDTFETLAKNAVIGTSSVRREAVISSLRKDLIFQDIRGTIERRLQKLEEGLIDGLVVAKCALIRLGLMHLNQIDLPGEGVPFQGRLAVTCREEDLFHTNLFQAISYENSLSWA